MILEKGVLSTVHFPPLAGVPTVAVGHFTGKQFNGRSQEVVDSMLRKLVPLRPLKSFLGSRQLCLWIAKLPARQDPGVESKILEGEVRWKT